MSSAVHCRYVRLSPNEEAAFIESKMKDKRRKRLIEVRQQEKEFARLVRENIQRKKKAEAELLEQHLKECAERRHHKELAQLKKKLHQQYLSMGQGQRDALQVGKEEEKLLEMRFLLASHQRKLAIKRQQVAMKELNESRRNQKLTSSGRRVAITRDDAGAQEREAAKLSKRNDHQSPPTLIMELEPYLNDYLSTRRVKGVECFASTYFHLPENLVDRETPPDDTEPDANQVALQVNQEETHRQKHLLAVHEEHREKARLRHKHALAKLQLEKDKDTMLHELSLLMREDRAHRQKVLQQIPNNVFQSVQDRLQQQEEEQRELEYAFEKLLSDQENIAPLPNPTLPTLAPFSTAEQSIPDANRPRPLTPPTIPIPLSSSLVTPLPAEKNPVIKQQLNNGGKSSVVVPCGTCEESDLSIHTIPLSEITLLSGTNPSSGRSHSDGNTGQTSSGDSVRTSNNTGTTSGDSNGGMSRLVKLIRSQQEAVKEAKQNQAKTDSSKLNPSSTHSSSAHSSSAHPNLSISSVFSNTDDDDSTANVNRSNTDHGGMNIKPSEVFTPLVDVGNDSNASDNLPSPAVSLSVPVPPSSFVSTHPGHIDTIPLSSLPASSVPPPTQQGSRYGSQSFTLAPHYYPWMYPQNTGHYPSHNYPWAVQYPSSGGGGSLPPPTLSSHPTEGGASVLVTEGINKDSVPDHTPSVEPLFSSFRDDNKSTSNDDEDIFGLDQSKSKSLSVTSPISVSMDSNEETITTPVKESSDSDTSSHDGSSVQERTEFISTLLLSLNKDSHTPGNESSDSHTTENESSFENESHDFSKLVSHSSATPPSTAIATPLKVGVSSQESNPKDRKVESHSVTIATATPTSSNSAKPLSLQEAFLKRNKGFIERSQSRVKEVETRALERQSSQSPSFQQRHVSFSNPLIRAEKQANLQQSSSSSKVRGPPARLISKVPQTISTKEMHKRSARLYSQLPEVKQKQQDVRQQEEWARNREKAKQFHENLRLKIRGKKKPVKK